MLDEVRAFAPTVVSLPHCSIRRAAPCAFCSPLGVRVRKPPYNCVTAINTLLAKSPPMPPPSMKSGDFLVSWGAKQAVLEYVRLGEDLTV